jgi:hypothetical protein
VGDRTPPVGGVGDRTPQVVVADEDDYRDYWGDALGEVEASVGRGHGFIVAFRCERSVNPAGRAASGSGFSPTVPGPEGQKFSIVT